MSKTKYVRFDTFTTALGAICAAIILLGTFVVLSAFADHETRYIAMFDEPCMQEGELKLCYVPFKVVIDAGSVVIWENVGKQVHTITSGTILEPTGSFNSGLIAPNEFYSIQFVNAGIYQYYCMVHPWMNGSVVVGEKITDEEKEEHLEEHEEMVVILEDGMFTNSTGTYYANGTAVIPEFGAVAMIVLATAIIGTVVIVKRGSMIGQTI
mgnify:CR=1 FL=1